jgi:hypothetical protein
MQRPMAETAFKEFTPHSTPVQAAPVEFSRVQRIRSNK